jgi:hypothetical protein
MNVVTPIEASNSLADLAARIVAEHRAVSTALTDSVRHAIAAGALLLEAKAQPQLKHGQWLPWLREHCTMSERTAQLYMRVAKNREEIEKQIRNGVADLSLNEAAALLMLSSDARKLMAFFQSSAGKSAEEIIQIALDQRVALLGVIDDPGYRVFAHCAPEGEREWLLFILFLSVEWSWYPDNAAAHVEYLSQTQFMDPDEWLGEEGEKFRRHSFYTQVKVGDEFKQNWAAFKERHRERTQAEIIAETDALYKERGPAPAAGLRRTKGRKRA